jgi:rare lipoprotein A
MRAAFLSVGAFAVALSPLVIGALPMTWSMRAWTPPPIEQPGDARPRDVAVERGTASILAGMLEGRGTANDRRYDADERTAAHPTLAVGTRVEVTHLDTGKSVIVRIDDRGSLARERVIDLSRGAAEALGIGPDLRLAPVSVRVIARPSESI